MRKLWREEEWEDVGGLIGFLGIGLALWVLL